MPSVSVSPAWLQSVAANSLSLPQRVASACRAAPDARPEVIARLRARWIQTAAHGDERAWVRRLEQSGWSIGVCSLLDRVEFPPESVLPDWLSHFEDLLESFAHPAPAPASFLDASRPVAYEALLAPVVERTSLRLRKKLGPSASLLAPEVFQTIERLLLANLSLHASGPFTLREEACRAAHFLSPTEDGDVFSDWLREGGVLRMFEETPVLARTLSTALALWLESNVEWIERFCADRTALAEWMGAACGTIRTVLGPLSHAHSRGRSVLLLALDSGRQLLYKPRPVDLERAVAEFSRDQPAVQQPAVLPRNGYGWVEYVASKDCAGREEVSQFYSRLGAALAVFHLLGSTDLHSHNILARGPEPLLLDGEFLLGQPAFRHRPDGGGAADADSAELRRSVLYTQILPRWREDGGGGYADTSAVGVAAECVGLRNIVGLSRPRVSGVPVNPAPFGGMLLEGFVQQYRRLLAKPARLVSVLQECFRKPVPVRVFLRGDQPYQQLALHGRKVQMLRNGAERFVEWDVLARLYLAPGGASPLWAFLEEEHAALERQDLPWMWTRSDSRDLFYLNGYIKDVFEQTPLAEVEARCTQLSAGDLERQSLYIRSAAAAAPISVGLGDGKTSASPGKRSGKNHASAWVAVAEAIATGLAVRSGGDSPFLTHCYLGFGGAFRLEGAPLCLRNGRLGLAVFFLSLNRVVPAQVWALAGQDAWQRVRAMLLAGRGLGPFLSDPFNRGGVRWVAAELADEAVLPVVDAASAGFLQQDGVGGKCHWEQTLFSSWRTQPALKEPGLRSLYGGLPSDSYFSGRAGLIELALASNANAFVEEQAGALAARAAEGTLVFHPAVSGADLFEGLGHGVAGVGFALLRAAAPQLVPSAFSWGTTSTPEHSCTPNP